MKEKEYYKRVLEEHTLQKEEIKQNILQGKEKTAGNMPRLAAYAVSIALVCMMIFGIVYTYQLLEINRMKHYLAGSGIDVTDLSFKDIKELYNKEQVSLEYSPEPAQTAKNTSGPTAIPTPISTIDQEWWRQNVFFDNEIGKITSAQVLALKQGMTYEEIISTLGPTRDVGSGLHVATYYIEDMDINFFISIAAPNLTCSQSGRQLLDGAIEMAKQSTLSPFNPIRPVTRTQVEKITPQMTYYEVIKLLGDTRNSAFMGPTFNNTVYYTAEYVVDTNKRLSFSFTSFNAPCGVTGKELLGKLDTAYIYPMRFVTKDQLVQIQADWSLRRIMEYLGNTVCVQTVLEEQVQSSMCTLYEYRVEDIGRWCIPTFYASDLDKPIGKSGSEMLEDSAFFKSDLVNTAMMRKLDISYTTALKDLEFIVSISSSSINPIEPIMMTVTVKNLSDKPIVIVKSTGTENMHAEINMKIRIDDKHSFTDLDTYGRAVTDDIGYMKLMPEGTFTQYMNMGAYYFDAQGERIIAFGNEYEGFLSTVYYYEGEEQNEANMKTVQATFKLEMNK